MPLGNVHITPQLVQAVRDAIDIVAIASDHTRLRKAGRRYQGLCPIHKEKTPSFSVDPTQGLFYCFGCGAGGDAIKLHMLTTGDDFPAAIENLAMRYGIPLPSRAEARFTGGRPERDLEGALQAAAEFFKDQLRKSAFAQGYLREKRRIPPELIERFGLGYAPEGYKNLLQALHPRISHSDLEAAGLIARSERSGDLYDRFRHRLMFPIHNAAGRLVGFGGRALGDDKAKYVNTNETDRFHKGSLLYGLHLAKREIRETGQAVLCEGYFDVISTVACGLEGAVAGMGTALTPEQTKLLARYTEGVVVAYDGDSAGENAFRRALPLLLAEGLGVRRARFPGSHDPDSLRVEAGEEAVRAAVEGAEDAVTAEIGRLTAGGTPEPQAQARAAREIAELLKPIPDAILRYSYSRIAAGRLGIPVEMLARRAGVGDRPDRPSPGRPAGPAGPQERPAAPPRLVRSLEEQVLEHLFPEEGTPPQVPPLDELPFPEVFLDPECRNIFEAFRTLYAGAGAPPDLAAVRSRLEGDDRAIARLAKIMVERGVASGKIGLLESLDRLVDRWRKQRRQEVQREIAEAQRKGDHALLGRLLDERDRLNRSHYRGSRPGANSGLA